MISYGKEVESLYMNIDNQIEKHFEKNRKLAPCKKGCSTCCSQFFEISSTEYIVIFNQIKNWDNKRINTLFNIAKEYLDKTQQDFPKLYNQIISEAETTSKEELINTLNKDRFQMNLPCIFLNEAEKICTVYESRPLICRTTGVGYTTKLTFGRICLKIKSSLFARRWQADLRNFMRSIIDIDVLKPKKYINHPNYCPISFKKRPIAYFIFESFKTKESRKYYENLCEKYYNNTKIDIANTYFEDLVQNSTVNN